MAKTPNRAGSKSFLALGMLLHRSNVPTHSTDDCRALRSTMYCFRCGRFAPHSTVKSNCGIRDNYDSERANVWVALTRRKLSNSFPEETDERCEASLRFYGSCSKNWPQPAAGAKGF